MSDKNDLWPDGILENLPRTPQDVLQAQAGLLGSKTMNLVVANVRTNTDSEGDIVHRFELRAPALQNYRYELFTMWHGVDLYPVVVEGGKKLEDESELSAFLAEQLRDEKTLRIIRALAAQAKREEEDSPEVPF